MDHIPSKSREKVDFWLIEAGFKRLEASFKYLGLQVADIMAFQPGLSFWKTVQAYKSYRALNLEDAISHPKK